MIGWFDPRWQFFHLSWLVVYIGCGSELPPVKQAAQTLI